MKSSGPDDRGYLLPMSPNETISRDPAAKEQPKEPPVQAVPKPPADPGLTALVMLLRFLGVPADPEQIRHQIGTVTRDQRDAALREAVRDQGAAGVDELGAAGEDAFAGHRPAARRRLPDPRKGRRRQGGGAVPRRAATGDDDQGPVRGRVGRPARPDDQARGARRSRRGASTSPGSWARSTNIAAC